MLLQSLILSVVKSLLIATSLFLIAASSVCAFAAADITNTATDKIINFLIFLINITKLLYNNTLFKASIFLKHQNRIVESDGIIDVQECFTTDIYNSS